MNVAISGSRTFADRHFVELVIERLLARGDFIIIGDAPNGVDSFAYDFLYEHVHFANWRRYRADWDRLGRRAGFIRNEAMIDDADMLVAIFADGERTPGTSNAVEQALAKGIPVHLYHESWLTIGGLIA